MIFTIFCRDFLLSLVKKYRSTRERKQFGECNTTIPELAATEVVKCVQYMRMDMEVFEELLSMVEPLIQRKSTSELNLHHNLFIESGTIQDWAWGLRPTNATCSQILGVPP